MTIGLVPDVYGSVVRAKSSPKHLNIAIDCVDLLEAKALKHLADVCEILQHALHAQDRLSVLSFLMSSVSLRPTTLGQARLHLGLLGL